MLSSQRCPSWEIFRLHLICHRCRSRCPKRDEGSPPPGHGELHEKASLLAQEHGIRATGSIVEGQEVKAILHYLKEESADLLVIGLQQHDFYLSRLWSSVYDLAQEAPCSVLGVH